MNAIRNSVRLIGHLGDDPKVKKLSSGRAVANFSIATNETYRDDKGDKHTETTWHRLVAWGKQAEIAEKHSRYLRTRPPPQASPFQKRARQA